MGEFDKVHTMQALGVVSEVQIDQVTEPFTFFWTIYNKNSCYRYRAVVPAGFITDYASTGPAAGLFKPNDPHYAQAAILHDFLCQRREVDFYVAGFWHRVEISRKECDDVFLDAMKALGCPVWKRTILYTAVRAYAISSLKF